MNLLRYKLWSGLLILGLTACNIDIAVSPGGRVVSDPALIDCRNDSGVCNVRGYENLDIEIEDLITTLRAIPDEGFLLDRWEGDCYEMMSNKCRVKLNGDIGVKAIFKAVEYAPGPGRTEQTVSFVALGDTGEGNIAQYQVATAIQSLCAAKGCDFALGLGDNFYDGTPSHTYDTQFEDKFEFPYQGLDIPFYMVLGNHDTGLIEDGDGGNQALGEVQVAYHYRTDRLSTKWQMPARYYSFTYPRNQPEPLAQFLALDSAPFVGLVDLNPEYELSQYARVEGAWVNQQLAQHLDSWKIAFAHHPYVSNGKHGNAGNYDDLLPGGPLLDKISGKVFRDFMENYVCDKVDLYLSGHDHNLQALQPAATCGKTEFIVTGAGAKANSLERPDDNLVHFQLGEQVGVFYIQIKGNELTLSAITVDPDSGSYREEFSKTLRRKIGMWNE